MRDREEGAEEEGGSLGSAVSMLRGALSFLDWSLTAQARSGAL